VAFRCRAAGVDLAEVFGFLSDNGLEGTLDVHRGGDASVRLYFREDGNIFYPRSGRRGQTSLIKILRHTGVLSREALERIRNEWRAQREEELVAAETDTETMQEALRKHLSEEIQDLFLWRDTLFEFIPCSMPAPIREEFEAGKGLLLEPKGVLFEVARRQDERRRIQRIIPSTRVVLRTKRGAGEDVVNALSAHNLDLLCSPFDGGQRVDDLLEEWGVPSHKVLVTVSALVEQGLLLPLDQKTATQRFSEALDAGNVKVASRILGHLVEIERRSVPGGPPAPTSTPFELGPERTFAESNLFHYGPQTSCQMRLGGPRAIQLARGLLEERRVFTLEIYAGGRELRLVGMPGRVTLEGEAWRGPSLVEVLKAQGAIDAETHTKLLETAGDPADVVERQQLDAAELTRIAGELLRAAFWVSADVVLTNRKLHDPDARLKIEVSLRDELREILPRELAQGFELFRVVPSEETVFVAVAESDDPAARFFSRFSSGRNVGELRRESRADPLEFTKVVAKGHDRGYLRRATPEELRAITVEAAEHGDDTALYRAARAACVFGYGDEFEALLSPYLGREPVTHPFPVMDGDLDGVGLGGVLQSLRDHRRTGTLSVDAERRSQQLYFHRGEAFLFAERDAAAEEFEEFFLGDGDADWGLESGEGDLADAGLKEAFFDSLYWEGATFTFRQNELPAAFFSPAPGDQKVELQTDAFLLEAMRSMAEWDAIREVLPSANHVLSFVSGAKARALGEHPDAALLLLIDGRQSFEDLVRISGESRLDAARLLAGLIREGQLEVFAEPVA